MRTVGYQAVLGFGVSHDKVLVFGSVFCVRMPLARDPLIAFNCPPTTVFTELGSVALYALATLNTLTVCVCLSEPTYVKLPAWADEFSTVAVAVLAPG